MIDKYKHFFFDMDGTLTESRTLITPDNSGILDYLHYKDKNISVISGASARQIWEQIPQLKGSDIYTMGQSGNDVWKDGEIVWRNNLKIEDIHSVLLHLSDVFEEMKIGQEMEPDRLEVRGGQVSYSFAGHNADKELKKAFDPGGHMRSKLLDLVPFKNDNMMVKIAGTTCFDYTKKGWGKAGNIKRLLEQNGWDPKDCLYVGDQLYPGGNDEDMMGLVDCLGVKDPIDLFDNFKNFQ